MELNILILPWDCKPEALKWGIFW
uniref:Uncharacterized protein n=1 Tax=Arundo donax TaxID=35708 RepID=A0A0A8Y433_ARUDO